MPERHPNNERDHAEVHQPERQPKAEVAVGLRGIQTPPATYSGLVANNGIEQHKTEAAEQIKEDQRDCHAYQQPDHDRVSIISQVDGVHDALDFRQWIIRKMITGSSGREHGATKI